ncbi:hypothetical protein [Horticoccus sp. 23ND18S-11]
MKTKTRSALVGACTAMVRNADDRKIMEGLQSKGDGRSLRVTLITLF